MSAPGAYHVPPIVVEQHGLAVSTRSSRVVLICSSEKCALRRERKCHPRELQIPNAVDCASQDFPRFCLSFSSYAVQPFRTKAGVMHIMESVDTHPCNRLFPHSGNSQACSYFRIRELSSSTGKIVANVSEVPTATSTSSSPQGEV